MIFEDVLKEISEAAGGVQGSVVMGMDGIPIGEYIIDPDCSIQTVGIEYANAIKSIQNASRSLNSGEVAEVTVNTDSTVFILRLINPEYFIALALTLDGNFGKARYLMRMAVPRLAGEFE